MKKIVLSIISFVSLMNFCHSQDNLVLKTNEIILSKIIEITPSDVKYRKIDNINGPLYTILKSEVIKIIYENGTIDIFNDNVDFDDENYLDGSTLSPKELTRIGNNVFIEIPDEASRAGEEYFINALREWGYWNVVTNKNEAHFIIVFNIDKKAMLDKSACVTFKTKQGDEFKKSEYYRASTTIFNGYNAFRAVAEKIVEKYLMKEYD